MKRFSLDILTAALVALMTLSAAGMAVARGQAAATGQMVICAGGVTLTVWTDAEGQPKTVWSQGKLRPSTSSPVVAKDRVYVVSGSGVLTAADAKTGKVSWRARLEGRGGFSATPIVAGGHVYLVDRDGLVQVVQIGETEGSVVGSIDLESKIQCTPALAGGGLFVRSDKTLWKIGKK